MQDLRAAPRWSKTAVIVVLVVFGLVLLVAVFGLWAFTSQRERNEAKARENAFADGRTLLEKVPGEIAARLEGVLSRARRIDGPLSREPNDTASLSLQSYLEGTKHGPLARDAWRIGEKGDVWWLGGRFLLWDRSDRIEMRARSESANLDEQKNGKLAALTAYQKDGPLGALGHWSELAERYGLCVGTDEFGEPFPHGMGYAAAMVTMAAEAAGADPQRVPAAVARNVVLRALMVVSLNLVRRPYLGESYDRYARTIGEQIERLLGHLPSAVAEPLAWEAEQFRAARAFLARTEPDNNYALLITARDHARNEHAGRPHVVVAEGPEVFGIENRSFEISYVVRMDATGIEHLVAGMLAAHENAFRSLGLEARWMPKTEDPRIAGFTGRSYAVQLRGAVDLPLQLAIFQTGEPRAGEDGFTNLLFWAVIGLAVAGLVTGGYVLVRLLTREIRLAKLKADFVSNLSHELKTPITSISLFTEMLDEGKITRPEDQREAYSVLAQESTRLQRIVNRIFHVARGEAGRTPYTLEPGDLNRPVLEAATRFRRIVTEQGLDLAIDLATRPLGVKMDAQAMDDVVTNLLSNAWKYRRGEQAHVAVRTARRGRFAEIVVTDDGVGIPRDERRKVFEMFYRSQQYLTHPVAGTGLGLALARSVVTGHGGRIEVESGERGVGTVFRVRIPLDRAAPYPQAPGSPAEPSAEHAPGAAPHGMVDASPATQDESVRSRATNPGSSS